MDVTLPGRYLVLTPFSQFVGISKHIADPAERKRISEISNKLLNEILEGQGIVVRTEAEGASEEDLRREAKYLMQTWKEIDAKYKEKEAPCIVHEDLNIAFFESGLRRPRFPLLSRRLSPP